MYLSNINSKARISEKLKYVGKLTVANKQDLEDLSIRL